MIYSLTIYNNPLGAKILYKVSVFVVQAIFQMKRIL